MKRARWVDVTCAVIVIAGLLWYTMTEVGAGNYWSAFVATVAQGALAAGLLLGRRWAIQAMAILLVLGNAFAVFELFPPFGDEVHPALSMGARVTALIAVTVGCLGLCTALYFRQRAWHTR
jgi:hypothetical protein